jgi:NPCBM/NEW2 domain
MLQNFINGTLVTVVGGLIVFAITRWVKNREKYMSPRKERIVSGISARIAVVVIIALIMLAVLSHLLNQGGGESTSSHQDKNLTDLKTIKYSPFSDLHFNESIEVDNKLRPNSIYYRCKECANQAQLKYNISGEWKRLDLHVGFSNKTPNYDQSAVFIVRTNGKEVFNEEVKKGEGMKEISLDVSKVNDIEFLASTNSTGDWADLVWVSPKLSN